MVENLLVLRSTARIKGDIQTMKLHIEEGAFFEGACVMRAGVSTAKLDTEPAFDE
jgi:cytoskeletal protein CcmA (bactofilin family)